MPLSPCVIRNQDFLNPLVKLVEIDVCQQWTNNAALRSSADCLIELPVLQIPSFEHIGYQADKSAIVDIFLKNFQQHSMVYRVEIFGNISLNKPACTFPHLNFLQSRVASPVGSKTMRMCAELRFIIRFQDFAHDFLQQLIIWCVVGLVVYYICHAKYGDSNILNINDSITDEAPPSPEERAKMDKEYLLWKSIVAAFCIIAVLLYVIPLIF